ncbi:MAG: rhomboid family intramembrane serine protease [Nocardiopsaceae bacterium]|jgi:membrane associated rhomboid family serine protease|nr:rhomboid family intramembrane serine protease [Nocardiopsaceae bacterium]
MSNDPSKTGSGIRSRLSRQGWTLDIGNADTVLAGARRALFVMVGVLVVIWAIQLANVADSYNLTHTYGIRPRDVGRLPDILTAPFLHFSWSHIEGNSGPLLIFGFLAAYRGLAKFAAVSVIVILTSGFAAWFFEPANSVGAGASGVVFGYFGYIIVRGLFDRHAIDVLIGAVMALCFAYQFSVLLPHEGIGWQAHVGGLVGGILAGWLLRERRAAGRAAKPAKAELASTKPGTTVQAASESTKAGKTTGKSPVIDPSNPRADLYKQLDDMGL